MAYITIYTVVSVKFIGVRLGVDDLVVKRDVTLVRVLIYIVSYHVLLFTLIRNQVNYPYP